MGQEFVVASFNTNRYYNKNTENIAVLPTGLTAGMVVTVGSDGTLDGNSNFTWATTTGITQTITATASGAETLHTWQVSDDAVAKLTISNSTATDGIFSALITGVGSSTSTSLNICLLYTSDAADE